MEQTTAELLSRRIHIAKAVLVREEYEMILLQGLMSGPIKDELIFKGGTALRLAYASPRFSEDLDFSLTKKIKQEVFAKSIQGIVEVLPTVKIADLSEKYYTHFALLKIREPYLKQAFSIKVEISKRPVSWKLGKDYVSRTCKSEVVPLTAVSYVVTLERVFADKQKAAIERDKARDLFDLWWLGKQLNKEISIKLTPKKLARTRAEINQFLPEHMRSLVDTWRKP